MEAAYGESQASSSSATANEGVSRDHCGGLEPTEKQTLTSLEPTEVADTAVPDDNVTTMSQVDSIQQTASTDADPAYDLALIMGEGALARALDGNSEPYPSIPESEEERDVFEAEFQQALLEMGSQGGTAQQSAPLQDS
ncbi:hypothetical protein Agub_g13207 [Astrephomene gubernaculifera]|uniref:Uncharacterized protein n=1 Tax=Astrephomene gubernaculifera TaxID=47775 RepID=A0AAD3E054_9CHLO|nr:hypothetical protein Agub_g13207 [Astrephomene gubernaculifera]